MTTRALAAVHVTEGRTPNKGCAISDCTKDI